MSSYHKNNEFFIALCKQKESPHSFVTLGLIDENNTPKLLCAFGKVCDIDYIDDVSIPTCLAQLLFSNTPGLLINERIFTKPNKIASQWVYYKSYSLNFKQYTEFLLYIKKISGAQNYALKGYVPTEAEEGNINFKLRRLSEYNPENTSPSSDALDISDSDQKFSMNNTCRHTAVNFIKRATHLESLGDGISSCFYQKPPLKAYIHDGKIKGHNFLVMPFPPAMFKDITSEKEIILTRLYNRLDTLILKFPNHPLTVKKFNAIKTLYSSLTYNKEANLDMIYKKIEDWALQNNTLISSHRGRFNFFNTKTKQLFNELTKSENRNRLASLKL